MTVHHSHPDIIKRLKWAEGHFRSVMTMLEEGLGCLDIAQQLQAVVSAVGNAKKNGCMTILAIAWSIRSIMICKIRMK